MVETSEAPRRRRTRKGEGIEGRVRAHDPFELIRWLAFSQTDPRKALAELVQNSLDARASRVLVTRFRHRGVAHLRVFDDGEGVIPEMDRRAALHYIATHIGHSRKRSLSPQERLQLLTQGQYGIGLLGFWSLGEVLEMRSAFPGQRAHRLLLYRDKPTFRIEPLAGRLPLEERWTEIVISQVHADAQRVLAARRVAEYLAAELRGQLLARDVDVVIEDRIARGTAQKRIAVRPPRFLGERIAGLERLDVDGHPPARLEVYWAGEQAVEDAGAGLRIYAAGTQVADGFHALASLGLDRAPWTDARLTGFVDFPAFRIAPGSRRGVIVDGAAEAFAAALGGIEPLLVAALERIEERRAAEIERSMVRDLQRAFRNFYRHRPSYSLLPVSRENDAAAGDDRGGVAGGASAGAASAEESGEGEALPPEADVAPSLLPPGPLAEVRLRPAELRLAPGDVRRLGATAVDASGRAVEEAVEFSWEVGGDVGSLEEYEASAAARRGAPKISFTFRAAGVCATGAVLVRATAASGTAEGEAIVAVTEDLPDRASDEGIPDPELIDSPGERWRSRMQDSRWQVNSGHPDFRELAQRPALKLRYLAMLFAKEVVLHDVQDPRLAAPLEQLVEVAAYADRQLAVKGRRGKERARDESSG